MYNFVHRGHIHFLWCQSERVKTKRSKDRARRIVRSNTHLSLWNFRLWTTCGIFWRKFHRCKVSSAVVETNAPSLIKNCNCTTAVHPSCLTCASTPGRPKLIHIVSIKEKAILMCKVLINRPYRGVQPAYFMEWIKKPVQTISQAQISFITLYRLLSKLYRV